MAWTHTSGTFDQECMKEACPGFASKVVKLGDDTN
jgi:hypothetical protein